MYVLNTMVFVNFKPLQVSFLYRFAHARNRSRVLLLFAMSCFGFRFYLWRQLHSCVFSHWISTLLPIVSIHRSEHLDPSYQGRNNSIHTAQYFWHILISCSDRLSKSWNPTWQDNDMLAPPVSSHCFLHVSSSKRELNSSAHFRQLCRHILNCVSP